MRLKNITAMLHARNMEFVRDRGTFLWSLVFPVFLVFGFAFAFSGSGGAVFKVGTVGEPTEPLMLLSQPGIETVSYDDPALGAKRVRDHEIDVLLDFRSSSYSVNPSSTKAPLLEEILRAQGGAGLIRRTIEGEPIRYVDWFVPGVIGMNLMFSCLFGVGFVIVRYRKNGVLKRLKATPLTAMEFVTAQATSRLIVGITSSALVFAGTTAFLKFVMRGSYLDLLIVALLSTVCMISFGLVFAARFRSEEVAAGVINVAIWPMLIFSGVFFSLETAPNILRRASRIFPLTHFLNATRAIMLDGATLIDVGPSLLVLAGMTVLFLTVAAFLFVWE